MHSLANTSAGKRDGIEARGRVLFSSFGIFGGLPTLAVLVVAGFEEDDDGSARGGLGLGGRPRFFGIF